MSTNTAQPTSKSAKKKAAKALERTESPAPSINSVPADKGGDSQDEGFESPYIKELHKNIRNTTKKLTNASKTDALLSQHPGKTLEELVDEKIINTDQKAQILKKPALQAQIAQFEEQLTQYKKVHEQYQAQATTDKAEWAKSLEKSKADAVNEAKEQFTKSTRDSLLVLSQFLRLAAYRREEAADPESDESQAIEGVLFAIYSGDDNAVSAMLKLIDGTDDHISSVPGEELQTTYAAIKCLAQNYQSLNLEGAPTSEVEETTEVVSDPTIAHQAGTEIDAGDEALVNGNQAVVEPPAPPPANTDVANEAANAAAENQWHPASNNDTAISQEWVDVAVPQEPAEIEAAAEVTPAAPSNKQSWADDQPEAAAEAAPAPVDSNDGFHQVQRNRGRQDREGGGGRGRGRGDWRGRGGHRGDGRGRGRGHRGGGGLPSRGPRRTEES